MRVSREQAAKNRDTIIAAASTLFREHGLNGVGIDDIMAQAGLTHGGFYRNFASKDDLATQAIAHAAAATAQRQSSHATLEAYVKSYLSPAHRDNAATGCVFAALGPDIARTGDTAGQGARAALTQAVRARIAQLAAWISTPRAAASRQRAIATLSAMVGALILARAVNDEKLSEEILGATRKHVLS
jgi:TetR/AcrR family transcriptional repressor of nem operon